jgi:uncharacterized protein (DUF983 family)
VAIKIFHMLGNGLRLRCPRCGIGSLYAKPFRMCSNCAQCGLKFEREQGYFVGAIYVNYAVTVLIAMPGFLILDLLTGMPINRQLSIWIPFAIIFPILFFHHSRSLWLAIDHWLNPAKTVYGVPPKGDRPFDRAQDKPVAPTSGN